MPASRVRELEQQVKDLQRLVGKQAMTISVMAPGRDEPGLTFAWATGARVHIMANRPHNRFAFKTAVSVGLLVLAVFLAFRKGWAWKSLFVVMAVSLLSFLVMLAGAIPRGPHSVSWQWLAESIPLDSLLLYGVVVFIFLRPSVRALYVHGEQT